MPASETPSADECILPDDDDIRIVTEPTPPAPPALTPRPAPERRNAQSIVLNNVTADGSRSFPLTTVYSIPPGANEPVPPVTLAPATISLDSDDDEPPPPAAPRGPLYVSQPPGAAPVPISLTAVHPSAVPPNISALKPKLLRKVVPLSSAGSPIILNSMGDSQAGGGNYILVPANRFSQAPPVVPVALNEVQYTPQGNPVLRNFTNISTPNFTNIPTPNQSDVIQFDPQESSPIVSNDIGAEQTVETTRPGDSAAQKSSKRVCKPGDILRITKGGEIEVLNRKDIPTPGARSRGKNLAPPPPPPAVPVQTRILRGSTEPTPIVPSVLEKTKSAAAQPYNKTSTRSLINTDSKAPPALTTDQRPSSSSAIYSRKGSSSSVSTIESRSPSPSDIFKNVVHIEADNYASKVSSDSYKQSTPAKETSNQPSTGNRNVISISSEMVTAPSSNSKTDSKWQSTVSHSAKTSSKTSTSNTKPSVSNMKPSTSTAKPSTSTAKPSMSNTKPSLSNTKPSTSTAKPSMSNTKQSTSTAKPSVSNTKPSASTTKSFTSTSKSSASNTKTASTATSQKSSSAPNKAKEQILDSVDLTDLDYLPAVIVSSHKKTKPQPNTIVGTSKSIILCASGKAVSKDISTKPNTT